MSEWCQVFWVLNEDSAEIGNIIFEFVTAAECTQATVNFGDVVSIDVVRLLHTDVGNKYSDPLLPLEEKILLDSKHLHQHLHKKIYSKQTNWGAIWNIEWFYTLCLHIWKNCLRTQQNAYPWAVSCE